MPYTPLWPTPPQFEDTDGTPLASGTLEFYLAGTSTPTNVFSDDTGTVLGTSVTLNARGIPESGGNVANIFRDTDVDYKVVLKDSGGSTIWTMDDIDQPNDSMFGGTDPDGAFVATTVDDQLSEAKGIFKLKIADESKASDTTLADDSTLAGFAIAAGAWYKFEAFIQYTQNVGDLKFAFDFDNAPQAFAGDWYAVDATGVSDEDRENFAANTVTITTMTDGDNIVLVIRGVIKGNATLAAVMDFQWAQNTSSANNTTVQDGSLMHVQRLK